MQALGKKCVIICPPLCLCLSIFCMHAFIPVLCMSAAAPAAHLRRLSLSVKTFKCVRLSVHYCVFALALFVCMQISVIAVQTGVGK